MGHPSHPVVSRRHYPCSPQAEAGYRMVGYQSQGTPPKLNPRWLYSIHRFTPQKNEYRCDLDAEREAAAIKSAKKKSGKTLAYLGDMFKAGLLDKKEFEAVTNDVLDVCAYEALFPP